MPWKETTPMIERTALLEAAKVPGTSITALCATYGVSRKTAYKWLKREREAGPDSLQDRSRRPQHSPGQTPAAMEAHILALRQEHPDWGSRKIGRVLRDRAQVGVPAASTITAILQRHQQIDPAEALKHRPVQRFARDQPNELWQMDFKGYFVLGCGAVCHPLTVLDDHSRFLVGLKACPNQTAASVQSHLTAIFEQYGLPEQMLMDNGAPWGFDQAHPHTRLTTWLLRLGIRVSHGRPYHPQTQGKTERLNRTLQAEVIGRYAMLDLAESQQVFDTWQQLYNQERPHDALQLDTPARHYHPSPRPFPAALPEVSYPDGWPVRQVDERGRISFHQRAFRVGKAFRKLPVALQPGPRDGEFAVWFCQQIVAHISFRDENE